MSLGLVAEFFVDPALDGVVVGSESASAFVAVAVFAADDRVSERVNVRCRLRCGCGFRCRRGCGRVAGHVVVPVLGASHIGGVLSTGPVSYTHLTLPTKA